MIGESTNGHHLNTITEEFRESIRGAARNNQVKHSDMDNENTNDDLDGPALNSVRSGRSMRHAINETSSQASPVDRGEKQPPR